MFSIHIHQRISKQDPAYTNLRLLRLAFAALDSTIFSGADLTRATFAHANLKSTNFANSRKHSTILTHVRWHHAQNLDRARLGTSNLQDLRVRNLLTTLNGIDQDFSNADLSGTNLAGAQLHRATLTGANLNGTILEAAELHNANLTNTNCIGTDFTAAHLTGATLEAWNIDSTTILKEVDCQYVFLLEHPNAQGSRERRPHNPDKIFQPGDFEKFFKDMLDTVQILIRNGVNPDSLKAAMQALMETHPALNSNAIQGFERKGDDVLVTLQVPEGTDKGDIERTWDEVYETRLQAATARAQLEAEKRRGDDIKDISLGFSKFLSSIEINNMNNPINTGDSSFVNTGDMQGNVINLGEISGQVSNQINQLPDTDPNPNQPSLKDLLSQLKAAIETDSELNTDEKAEALNEVAKLAKAGSDPKESKMQALANRATTTLKSIASTLTDASKLADACKKLLPLITALF